MTRINQDLMRFSDYVNAGDEAAFARSIDGQLIRRQDATEEDFQEIVSLTIDGLSVEIPRAVPLVDAQGIAVQDREGKFIPRFTTIYDALLKLEREQLAYQNPVSVLCYQEHQKPVGVCRVCMVEVQEYDPEKKRNKKAIVPSCVYHVQKDMKVTTTKDESKPEAKKLKELVKVVVELLATEHLTEEQRKAIPTKSPEDANEFERLVAKYEASNPLFTPSERSQKRGKDSSSLRIMVDHDACVLCQRCNRACIDIKHNNVIGRTGKGDRSKISFDFDAEMKDSSCVGCGECAFSCPTNALTLKPSYIQEHFENAQIMVKKEEAEFGDKIRGECLSVQELREVELFAKLPHWFLELNRGAIIRKKIPKDGILCEEGKHGTTAFLIQSGKFEVFLNQKARNIKTQKAGGIAGLLGGLKTIFSASSGPTSSGADDASQIQAGQRIFRTKEDIILGEMTCLNRYPRSATVKAVEDSEVIEIRRNVLEMLQRTEGSRKILDTVYRNRALNSQLENMRLFDSLSEGDRKAAAKLLAQKATLLQVEPGRVIFKEGEFGDDLYLVRLGHVKVSTQVGNVEQVLNYKAPGTFFGEIAAISALCKSFKDDWNDPNFQPGIRTATCSALDHVEIVEINEKLLAELVTTFPQLEKELLSQARSILESDKKSRSKMSSSANDFLEQGLFNAKSLLVLDLEACTRCDECTKACADTHDDVTRLIREGLRFDKYLIASSCRSCLDPYCLVGCPVSAIHREGSSEIRIEDHCIGCGQCANNCPYGNINLHTIGKELSGESLTKSAQVQKRATTCDLCRDAGGTPRCVYACPHEAAFRMDGPTLKRLTEATR